MPTKLTLSIDQQVILKAKKFAKNSGRSLSEIVESYLDKITTQELNQGDKELNKIFGIIHLPEDFDEKQAIRKIRREKEGFT